MRSCPGCGYPKLMEALDVDDEDFVCPNCSSLYLEGDLEDV